MYKIFPEQNSFYRIGFNKSLIFTAVHNMLHDLLPNGVYYRFNPYVKEVASMFEIRSEKLEELEREASLYARRNEEKFQQAAATLTQPRSHLQKGQDWVKQQMTLLTSAKPQ